MPESSASAGSPDLRLACRALASAFSTKVGCGSSASATPSRDCGSTSMPSGASSASISRSFPGLDDARTSFFTAPFYRRRGRPSLGEEGLLLLPEELRDAAVRELEERIELLPGERRALGRPLPLDEPAGARHHDVHVGVA